MAGSKSVFPKPANNNIGSWAPGELDKMMTSARVVRLPVTTYKKWFSQLPADFKKSVIAQWGTPDAYKMLKDGDDFIIPAVTINILVLLLEPSRGWGDEAIQKKLGVEYAVSVVQKGVACCDHTCNNPLLNQMVVSIISLPGVMSPEMVENFKLAIEQATKKSLDDQVADRKDLQQQLTAPARENIDEKKEPPQETGTKNQSDAKVEGYKMEKMDSRDDSTQVTSSGVE